MVTVKSSDKAAVFRMLGDPARLKIVEILLGRERCACELPSLIGKAQPTVSLHLKKLVAAGVLSFRKDGTKVIYRVSNPNIAKLLKVFK